MGGDRGDKRAKGDKSPRPEPNLELPSFRLGRGRRERGKSQAEGPEDLLKREPSVPTPERSVPTRERSVPTPEPSVQARKAPPPPARTAPPPPPPATAKRSAPPPPSRRLPPAPPPIAGPQPDDEWSIAELETADFAPTTSVQHARDREEPKVARVPKAPKTAKEPRPPKGAPKARKEPKPPRPPKAPRQARTAVKREVVPLRWLPGYIAAIITGALMGGLTVVLAWATAQGCAAVRGVGTCGGYGVFALVAILGIDVVIATGILRICRVTDPATTAMLGVGLVALLAMVFFLGDTQSFAMVYVIPSLMAATFGLAWWLTAAIAQRAED